MSEKKEKREQPQTQQISRRRFLAAAASGAAAAGLLSVSGCAPKVITPTQEANQTACTQQALRVTDTSGKLIQSCTTDVLVIGGGIAGLFAASKALSEGANVIVVDKGPFGHSGASGLNWGHDMATNEFDPEGGKATAQIWAASGEGMVDQDLMEALCFGVFEARPVASSEQMGTFVARTEDGESEGRNTNLVVDDREIALTVDHGCYPRAYAQYARRSGSRIFDRTMVIDLLVADNRCVGALALNLVTGGLVIYRAKAVIMATGGYASAYGWRTAGAASIDGAESVGDGQWMLLNHGLPLVNMEQLCMDFVQVYPDGFASSIGAIALGTVNDWAAMNSEGRLYIAEYKDAGEPYTAQVSKRLVYKELLKGYGSPNGGTWVDLTHIDKMGIYYADKRATEMAGPGYALPDKVEVVGEFWASGARPILTLDSQTQMPGLFYAGMGDSCWTNTAHFNCVGSGYIAGRSAAQYAAGASLASIDWDQVQALAASVYGVLEANPVDKVRPHVVFHAIQQVFYKYISPLRDEKGLQSAIAELERIRKEDMPRVWVSQKTQHFNNEWKRALEIPHMWDCVMGTATAALFRTETRGTHMRIDYPKLDNNDWLKHVLIEKKDGQFLPGTKDIDMSVIPKIILKTLIKYPGIE